MHKHGMCGKTCEHASLKYCKHCQLPYCVDCGKEWGFKFNNGYLAGNAIDYYKQAGQVTYTSTCKHGDE